VLNLGAGFYAPEKRGQHAQQHEYDGLVILLGEDALYHHKIQ
jgi:hypothetical protein